MQWDKVRGGFSRRRGLHSFRRVVSGDVYLCLAARSSFLSHEDSSHESTFQNNLLNQC